MSLLRRVIVSSWPIFLACTSGAVPAGVSLSTILSMLSGRDAQSKQLSVVQMKFKQLWDSVRSLNSLGSAPYWRSGKRDYSYCPKATDVAVAVPRTGGTEATLPIHNATYSKEPARGCVCERLSPSPCPRAVRRGVCFRQERCSSDVQFRPLKE